MAPGRRWDLWHSLAGTANPSRRVVSGWRPETGDLPISVGADVATYLTAKNALANRDPNSVLEISANFRSQPPILEFVNQNFAGMLDVDQGQPGFAALAPVRNLAIIPAVATFDITVEDRHRGEKGLVADALEARRIEHRRGHRPAADRHHTQYGTKISEPSGQHGLATSPSWRRRGPACGSMSERWKAGASQSPPRRARDSSTARKSRI